jgi:hypothetical protein
MNKNYIKINKDNVYKVAETDKYFTDGQVIIDLSYIKKVPKIIEEAQKNAGGGTISKESIGSILTSDVDYPVANKFYFTIGEMDKLEFRGISENPLSGDEVYTCYEVWNNNCWEFFIFDQFKTNLVEKLYPQKKFNYYIKEGPPWLLKVKDRITNKVMAAIAGFQINNYILKEINKLLFDFIKYRR